MEAERWDQLAVLFEQAMARLPEERAAFLDDACADEDLRRQLDALLHSSDEAHSYFDDLAEDVFAAPGEAVQPAQRVGPYEVLEKLGGGGMGVVYKAHDTRLGRAVALKFLPPALSADAQAKERFIAEAKAASALDHANICTIHEIGETDDGQLFIAMAYYEGQTLKARIKQGPLPVDDALHIAAQMAQGLAKAHSKGIIHRDIKPANLMLAEDDVVKIVDFGLAKMSDVQLTKTGTTMGTVAYMSPEQTRGAPVDHRTDVWSLGVVLYEMLTGERPFKGEHEQAIIYSIVHQKSPSARVLNPAVPGEVADIVALCLEKKPEHRYATMDALLADLHLFMKASGLSFSATLQAVQQRQAARRRRVAARLGGGVALLLILALLIPTTRQILLSATGLAPSTSRTYVAVLPFTSNTPDDQALADGLMQAITSLVARLEAADVVPAHDILDRAIKTPAEARKLFGVNTVLRGRVQRLGTETEVIVDLEDPRQVRVLDSATLPAPSDPAFQEQSLRALARLLGVGLSAQTRQRASADSPNSPDAYDFYIQGQGYLQRYDQAGNLDNAIALFTQALQEDARYAPAQAGLCEATWEKYRKTTDTNLAREALRHCDEATALAAEQAPVLVTLGSIYLQTGQHKKAEDALLRAQELDPANADAYRWLGRVYEDQVQIGRAERAYQQAIVLKRNIWIYYNELGSLYYFRGRYEEARAQFEQVRRLTPDTHLAYNALAFVELRQNRVQEAEALFRKAIDLEPGVSLAYRNLGRLYVREQQYDEAIRWLEKARAVNANDQMVWSALGHAYYGDGEQTQARGAWEALVEMITPKLEVNPKSDLILRLLADAHAALGNQEQGVGYLNRLLAVEHGTVSTKYYIGRTYEMLGDRDMALNWIEKALVDHFDPLVPERDPWLSDLRKTPGYQALRAQFLQAASPPAG